MCAGLFATVAPVSVSVRVRASVPQTRVCSGADPPLRVSDGTTCMTKSGCVFVVFFEGLSVFALGPNDVDAPSGKHDDGLVVPFFFQPVFCREKRAGDTNAHRVPPEHSSASKTSNRASLAAGAFRTRSATMCSGLTVQTSCV